MNNYKILSNYLKQLLTTSKQIKNIIYHPSFKLNVTSSYSLLSTCINNHHQFLQYKSKVEAIQKIDIANPYLFSIMTGQYINTGNIKGGGKLKRMIIKNSHLLTNIQKKQKINKGHVQIRLRKDYQHKKLNLYQKDSQIPNLIDLQYSQYSKLLASQPQLLKNPNIIIQSRSSCIPAFILFQGILNKLDQFKKFDIIDCCAAPGNKTLQLAQYLQNNGKVFAFQKDSRRFETLNRRINFYGQKNIETFNQDFLKVDPKRFKNVKFILADPSCSGSGMLINYQKDNWDIQNKQQDFQSYCQKKIKNFSQQQLERILNLQKFQLQILRHCSKFNPLRLVYSTCSIYRQQNEEVVQKFLSEQKQYEIKGIKSKFEKGFGKIGEKCVRINPLSKKTDGFFVCLFKRKVKK